MRKNERLDRTFDTVQTESTAESLSRPFLGSKIDPPGVILDRFWSLRGGFEDLRGLFLNIPFPTVFQKVFPYKDRLQAMPFQRAFEKACCFFAARCPQGMPFHSPFEKAPLSRHLFSFFLWPKICQKLAKGSVQTYALGHFLLKSISTVSLLQSRSQSARLQSEGRR